MSRLMIMTEWAGSAEFPRRGLALKIEHDFWREPSGDVDYRQKLAGMKSNIQTTIALDVSQLCWLTRILPN